MKFVVESVRVERYAAVPTLAFQLRLESQNRVGSVMLTTQILIESRRRTYLAAEQRRLLDLLGEPARWKETGRNLLWAKVPQNIAGFEEKTEVDLMLPCSFDFEIVASRYLHALDSGEIPLLFLFSGTVMNRTDAGLMMEPISSEAQVRFSMPVETWKELMKAYYPEGGWLRLSTEALHALQRYRAEHALTNWDEVILDLMGQRL